MKYHEEHQHRRRHEAAGNIAVAISGAVLYFGLFNPTWVGEGREAIVWFLRVTGVFMLVAAVGIILQVRRHRQSKLDNDVEFPPSTGADAQQRPSA
ncbi:MAG: hypothetical protein ACM3JF_02020 [Sphaerimonospora mesophila]